MSERTATRIGKGVAILALSAGWLAAALLLLRTTVPSDLDLPELDPHAFFSTHELARHERYEGLLRVLFLPGVLAQIAVLVGLVLMAPRLLRNVPFHPLVQGAALAAAAVFCAWLAQLPIGLVAQWWRRRYGISGQDYLGWAVDPWLEVLARAGVTAAAAAVAMALAARLGSRWWLVGAPLFAAGTAAVVVAQPLLLQPRVEPLRNPALKTGVRRLAEQTGVGKVDVVVREMRTRTRVGNAEVYGLGATRRVVLWDTLLEGRFSRGEIEVLVAHELGHIARHHVWKGLAWAALLSFPVLFLVAQAARLRGGLSRPEAVPVVLLAVALLALALLPAANAVSRRYEAEADWAALQATRDPTAMEALLLHLARTSLADPDPPGWAYVLLRTHPTVIQRLAMAQAWRARSVSARPRRVSPADS